MAQFDPGGLEVLCTTFMDARISHTLKRTLTDQRIFAGIGNAYSDEILLHAAVPFKLAKTKKANGCSPPAARP